MTLVGIFIQIFWRKILPNNAFKWDSCRVAFLVCGDFCGESGVRKLGLGGIHPLMRRYVAKDGRWNKMLNLLRFFLISNLTASAVVVMFEKSTGFFGLRFWPDYAFFVVVILWGLAALFFMYPPEGGFGGDRAESVAGSMVDSSVANEIDSERFSSNTMLCIKLFVSGLPAFLTCIIVSTAT